MANFEQVIKELITTRDFSNSDLITLLQNNNFVSNLATFMLNEYHHLDGVNPLNDTLFPSDVDSLFEKINNQIDLDVIREQEDAWEKQNLLNKIKTNSMWNESVATAIQNFLQGLDQNGEIGDAGENFDSLGIIKDNSDYVKANTNQSGSTYTGVRGDDFNENAAKSSCHLGFTDLDDTFNALRLLMPEYKRRVEIEDLNRNFWVLGTTMSKAFVAIGDLLSEIVQIWENLLYLWVAIYLLGNKNISKGLHTEVIILSNNDYKTYMNLDNFEDDLSINSITDWGSQSDAIIKRINYIAEQYSEYDICIFPVIRRKNYYKEYYKEEEWLGCWTKKIGNSSWSRKPFVYNGKPLVFSIDDFSDRIGAISDSDANGVPYYGATFSNINSQEVDKDMLFYGMVRIIPYDIDVTYDDNGDIVFNSMKWKCCDASQIKTNNDVALYIYTANSNGEISRESRASIATSNIEQIKINNIVRGYYRGELLSYFKFLEASEIIIDETNLTIQNIKMPTIYRSQNSSADSYLVTLIGKETLRNNLKQYAKDILTSNRIKVDYGQTDTLRLYRGHFPIDAFRADENDFKTNPDSNDYYYLSGGAVYHDTNYTSPDSTLHCLDIESNTANLLNYAAAVDRVRDAYYSGCILMLPNGTSNSFDDYCFLDIMLPLTGISNYTGDYDRACRLLAYADNFGRTTTDTQSAGRRSKVVSRRDVYAKNGKITTTDWAVVITEISMTYAPTLVPNSSSQWVYGGNGIDSTNFKVGSTEVGLYSSQDSHSVYTSYCPEAQINNLTEIPTAYAPFPMLAEHNGNKGYYFPLVTRVSQHLFYCNNGNYGYARRSKNSLALNWDGNNYYWIRGGSSPRATTDLPDQGSFDILNNFTLQKTGSTWQSITDLNTFIQRVCGTVKLDFYKYPINGYSL